MAGKRQQPSRKQQSQRTLLSMFQGSQQGGSSDNGSIISAGKGGAPLSVENEEVVSAEPGPSKVVMNHDGTPSSVSSSQETNASASTERQVRPLPRAPERITKNLKGKFVVRESNTTTGPTKVFPIFSKDRGPSDVSGAITSPASLQDSVDSLAPNTQPLRRRPVKRVAREDSLSCGTSSQLSNGLPADVINVDDHDLPPTPQFCSQGPGTQEEPITIESSPIKSTKPTVPVHSFFAPRKAIEIESLSITKAKGTSSRIPEIAEPWPDGGSQHIRGEQRGFAAKAHTFNRVEREKVYSPSLPVNDPLTWLGGGNVLNTFRSNDASKVKLFDSPSERHSQLLDICSADRTCHAINRFSSADFIREALDLPQEAWVDKWRPRKAEEVLGNADNAVYLRDWLLALELRVPSPDSPGEQGEVATAKGRGRRRAKACDKEKRLKRTVIREIDKKRLKRRRVDSDDESLGDWIVDDDQYEDHFVDFPPVSDDDVFSGALTDTSSDVTDVYSENMTAELLPSSEADHMASDPPTHETEQPTVKHDFSNYLTNCIMLVGPPGTGKTAAIYACAEELGWEVFEVYPGIGKRSGNCLDSLVGDVCKNHIVGRASTRPTCASPRKVRPTSKGTSDGYREGTGITEFFSSGTNTTRAEGTSAFPNEALSTDIHHDVFRAMSPSVPGFGFIAASQPQSSSNKFAPVARQSIILLEEVDVLYAEDINFWPVVIKLVRESMRPVVLTCNDLSIVPVSSLPLQTILKFSASPIDRASTYLRAIALAEGFAITHEDSAKIYECTYVPFSVDVDECLSRSIFRHNAPVPDLRKAIYQLQYSCRHITLEVDAQSNGTFGLVDDELDLEWGELPNWPLVVKHNSQEGCSEDPSPDQEQKFLDLRPLARVAEALSVTDSYVRRRPWAVLEAFYTTSGESIGDYEIGYTHLRCDSTKQTEGLAYFNRDDEIALETIRVAGRVVKIADADSRYGSKGDELELTRSETGRKGSDIGDRQATFLAHVEEGLAKVVPTVPAIPLSSIVCEYEPWVRWMVLKDDELEAESKRAVVQRRGGRMTRNSQREEYVRWVTLSEWERGRIRCGEYV